MEIKTGELIEAWNRATVVITLFNLLYSRHHHLVPPPPYLHLYYHPHSLPFFIPFPAFSVVFQSYILYDKRA
jgi:hypothetical protein